MWLLVFFKGLSSALEMYLFENDATKEEVRICGFHRAQQEFIRLQYYIEYFLEITIKKQI